MIKHEDKLYVPAVPDGVKWETDRKGSPGKLTFSVIIDKELKLTEGDNVRLTVDDTGIFNGFAFSKSRDKQNLVQVTAFDQLRYLCNKDTYVYRDKTASEVIKMVADDFSLQLGTIEDTSFKIGFRYEDNLSLFDIIYNALDLELSNTEKMYVLYDDFGKLTLKSLDSMKVDVLIDEATGENFDYSSTINDETYNKVKLYFDSKKKKREAFSVEHEENIKSWGVLQLTDKVKEGEDGKSKADAMLKMHNVKTRRLKINKARGDVRVRAGCMVNVKLELGDVSVNNYMTVERCEHTFGESEHWMDLTLKGGEING